MAETPSPPPSPYAPGIISEERAPPRPAGRPVVFLLATFLLALVTSAPFWWRWAMQSDAASAYGRAMRNWFFPITTVSGLLILLWAYLSDRVAVWGTRREGYLLLCGLTMSITWAALALFGDNDVAWVVALVDVGIVTYVSRAVIAGGLAEIGRRRAATGRLAAANIGLARLALLVASPVLGVLTSAPMAVTAGIAAGLSLTIVLVVVTLSDDGGRSPDPAPTGDTVTIPKFLRSRTFWSSAALLALAGLGTVPWEIITPRLPFESLGLSRVNLAWVDEGPTIVAAIGYLFLCRRVAFRRILRFALFAQGLALFFFKGSFQSSDQGPLLAVALVVAICAALVDIALFDLALRAAPRGREAFGAILLGGVGTFIHTIKSAFERMLDPSAGTAALLAVAATIAAAITVSLLPRPLVETRDGEQAPA